LIMTTEVNRVIISIDANDVIINTEIFLARVA